MFDNIKLEKDKYYFLSPFGLGDTMILCGFKNKIEAQLDGQIVFIVKPSHKIIMKMYGIKNYILLKSNQRFDFNNITLSDLAKESSYPQKGTIFVAHWGFFPEYKELFDYQINNKTFTFLDAYKLFFHLNWNTELEQPGWLPSVTPEIQNKLPINAKISNLVIFIPEAHSINNVSNIFWLNLQDKLKKQKLDIYTAVSDSKNKIYGIPNIDLSIEELLAISLHCHSVYTLRNGLCDLISSKDKNLYVIYPDINTYYYFRLKTIFPDTTANEVIMRGKDYGF